MVVAVVALAASACSSSSKNASTKSTSSTSAAASPTNGAKGAAIKVGVVCTCSGPFGADEGPAEQVYKAWADSVNASGGINGHPVQLVTEDDAGNPGTSVSDIQTLLSDHVVAIADLSLVDEPWAKTVESAKIPVVGADITETPFYSNPDFYPVGETEDALAPAFVSVAKMAGASRLAYFYCTEAAACTEESNVISSAAQSLGTPVVYKAAISATAPNYTAQCVAAQQAHVDAILNGDVDPVFKRAAANCSQQGYHPIYISSGESYDVSMNTATGLAQNTWYESNDLPFWVKNPATEAMNAAVNKYYPGLVDKPTSWSGGTSVETWAAGVLLDDAVKAGGLQPGGTPTSAEITRGLSTVKNDTLGGLTPPLTFVSGQPHPVHCWFTFRVQNGTPSMTNGGKVTCENGSAS